MIAKLLPLAMALIGTGTGVGAALMLRDDPAPASAGIDAAATPCGDPAMVVPGASHAAPSGSDSHGGSDGHGEGAGEEVFVKLDRQFIVPVISDGRVGSMVVMSLTLEVDSSARAAATERRPRLHDRFLRVMLDHANSGGFEGTFTANGAMDRLNAALLEAGRKEIGPGLKDILVIDLNREEV